MNRQQLGIIAGVMGATGVAIGAFGAHGLPNFLGDIPELPRRIEQLETGARYHMYHALALFVLARGRSTFDFAVGADSDSRSQRGEVRLSRMEQLAAIAWLVGIAIFSGSLYALVLSGMTVLGAVVPIGGVSLMVGWIAAALSFRTH